MRGRSVVIAVLCASCGGGAHLPKRLGEVPDRLGDSHVRAFAVGERGVFLAESSGRIARVSRSGGDRTVLAAGQKPWSIAVDGSHVYWANGDGAVRRVAVAGGRIERVGRMAAGPAPIGVDEGAIYWVSGGRLVAVRKDGLTPTTLARAQAFAGAIALDTTSVYWVDDCAGAVRRASKRGGPPTDLAELLANPSRCQDDRFVLDECQFMCSVIAVDETHVYWVEADRVRRVPKSGGAADVVAAGLAAPVSVAVDSRSVYFTTRGERDIYHFHHDDAPVDDRAVYALDKRALGAEPLVLATSLGEYGFPSGVAVDAEHVYWRDGTACVLDKPSTTTRR